LWYREIEEQGIAAIVVTASGCGTTLKDYGFMLRNDPRYAERAARVSALAKDLTELLANAQLPFAAEQQLSVAYHAACSLQHGQKVVDVPVRLLKMAGFVVHTPAEAHLCCGSAGVYNILQPELAGRLGDRKVANLRAVGGDVIASTNIGCATQIGQRTQTPVLHLAELLDWASGGPCPESLSRR
ncbi:MAG: glycolate oxidase iron-sulfur subunit, partial [Hyphomicrobiales bacterium]